VVVADRQTDRKRDKHANFIYSPLYTERHDRHIEISLTMALKSVTAGCDINLEVLSWTRSLAATELMEYSLLQLNASKRLQTP